MVYLLYGVKDFLIKKELDELSKGFDSFNISKFDLSADNIDEFIDDCMTISMFGDSKFIIGENAIMFSGSSSKNAEVIEKYLNNINPSVTVVFVLNNDKIDERKKITKLLKKVGTIKSFNENGNIMTFVRSEFKGYNIDKDAVNLLIDRVGDNQYSLLNEIEKLKLYKSDNISYDDVMDVTSKNVEVDIFKLIECIVSNDKDNAMEIYSEMIKHNEEPIKIIIMLANQFRIMYQSKELSKKGLLEKDIASVLKIHPYRVKLALQNSRKYSSKVLLKYISDLADLDYNIKSGNIDKYLALELFILKK